VLSDTLGAVVDDPQTYEQLIAHSRIGLELRLIQHRLTHSRKQNQPLKDGERDG